MKSTTYGVGTVSLGSIFHAADSDGETKKKPNFIFIFTDDQRWDTLSCAGNPIIHTPVMDNLAKNGVRFENAFVTSPICAPSRASLFTGLYERKHCFTFGTPQLSKDDTDISYPKPTYKARYCPR